MCRPLEASRSADSRPLFDLASGAGSSLRLTTPNAWAIEGQEDDGTAGAGRAAAAGAAYARLWAAGWASAAGSQLTAVVVPLEIYGFSGSSAYVGLASLTGLVPMVVAALWGGALANTVDRRRMLLVTSAGIGVTSILLWAQAAAGLKSVAALLLIAVQ